MKSKISFFVTFVTLFSLLSSDIVGAEIDIKTPIWQKVKELGKENHYVFLFFGDTKTQEAKKVFASVNEVRKESGKGKKVDIIKVAMNSPKETELVKFLKVTENPTVVVIAPNGAITGYFAKPVGKKVLVESLISAKESEIVKHLQEGRVIFLCFYDTAESRFSAIKTDLEAVTNNFKGAIKVIYIRDDENEDKLKSKFEVSSDKLTTVFVIIPPGRTVAKLTGADITKENLMRKLYSSCGGGSCSPGGCKPR
jgi:hypothetical protein